MSPERAGTPTQADEPYAVVIPVGTRHGAEQVLRMLHDASGDFRAVVEERAGTSTHGALNRVEAAPTIWAIIRGEMGPDRALDVLEACVVPDPRIGRIEAELDRHERETRLTERGELHLRRLRAILRGVE